MKANRLKECRVSMGETQSSVARSIGVSQPTYQRWEAEAASIPKSKLDRLAVFFGTTPDFLLMQEPSIQAGFHNPEIGPELNYYGEVAIHFVGSGSPILLSISEKEVESAFFSMNRGDLYLSIASLTNQTAIIRTEAIADMYFSHDACDSYGPNDENYEDHIQGLMPDPIDWRIVESLAREFEEEELIEEFGRERVLRIKQKIMITDKQYQKLVADGRIEPRNLAGELENNDRETKQILKTSTHLTYQLTSGRIREVHISDPSILAPFEPFSDPIIADAYADGENHIIAFDAEDYARKIFLNMKAVDYVLLPSHMLQAFRIEEAASLIDEELSDDAR